MRVTGMCFPRNRFAFWIKLNPRMEKPVHRRCATFESEHGSEYRLTMISRKGLNLILNIAGAAVFIFIVFRCDGLDHEPLRTESSDKSFAAS